LGAAVGGGAFGYVAARRMLRPVQALTQAAVALRRAPAEARLPELSDPQDEIGRLGRVLNDLITDLDQQRQRDRMLLAEAAHQLRTPLQIMQGNAALLAGGTLDPAEAQESLAAMQQALSGMTRLTNDFLTLEGARTRRPEPESLVIDTWLEGLREDAQALAPELDVRVLPPSAHEVRVDVQILTRAYWALLENALHYTPKGGRITLGASLLPDGVEVYVRDSGPGIDKDELPFVTERFFRGRQGRQQRGTGLGLPIAKALAESIDGILELRSAPGAGTTAAIRLPRDS
jgi:signal transduction histidine kinase